MGTAVFALCQLKADGNYLIKVANTGDSRAYIGRGDAFNAVTVDHTPNNERRRTEAAGGHVENNYVNGTDGSLGVGRAIGDFHFKHPQKLVVATPDIFTHEAKKNQDGWLLLCCDGLVDAQWDEKTMMKNLHDTQKQHPDVGQGLSALLDNCLKAGSTDNMSTLLVYFQDGSNYGK